MNIMSEENKEPEKETEPETTPPSEEFSDILTVPKPEGRRKCPKCGEEHTAMIHESVDKGVIILDYPRIWGKKYKCGKCGCEWREK